MIRSLRDSATWRSLIGYCSSLLFIALHCFAIYSRASALSGQSDEGSFPQAVFFIIVILLFSPFCSVPQLLMLIYMIYALIFCLFLISGDPWSDDYWPYQLSLY